MIEGRAPFPPNDGVTLGFHTISPAYFATMAIPVLRGRPFDDSDTATGRQVIIISQVAASRFFPGEDPIGHRIDWGFNDGEWKHVYREIVGVVGDVRRDGLNQPIDADGYVPLAQNPDCRTMSIVVRSPRGEAMLHELPSLVESADANQDVDDLAMVEDLVAESIKSQRHVALVLTAFAIAALALAGLGLFGLVSYATAQRTREIGIRMALGSPPEAAIGFILLATLRVILGGLCLGLAGAFLLGRALGSRLPEVSAFDGMVYSLIPLIVAIVSVMACVVPAWRAARISPAIALRYG
jgi:hypothetical protein